jgi:hypothetical protein
MAGAGQNSPWTRPLSETLGRSSAKAKIGETISKTAKTITSARMSGRQPTEAILESSTIFRTKGFAPPGYGKRP